MKKCIDLDYKIMNQAMQMVQVDQGNKNRQKIREASKKIFIY